MNRYLYIIRLLVIGCSFFTFGQCRDDENGEEAFAFEIELYRSMWTVVNTEHVNRVGPKLTDDKKTLRKLAVAAANFISFEFEDPECPHETFLRSSWGSQSYPHKGNDGYINYMDCETKPRIISIRATSRANKYIVMVPGFYFSLDGFNRTSPREYSFDVKIMETDPEVKSVTDKPSVKDLILKIENVDVRNIYQEMKFLDMMHVCVMAAEYILNHFSMLKPETVPSTVGFLPLKLYNYKRGQLEEHVGYRCPIKPLLFIYFEDSASVGVVLLLQPDH